MSTESIFGKTVSADDTIRFTDAGHLEVSCGEAAFEPDSVAEEKLLNYLTKRLSKFGHGMESSTDAHHLLYAFSLTKNQPKPELTVTGWEQYIKSRTIDDCARLITEGIEVRNSQLETTVRTIHPFSGKEHLKAALASRSGARPTPKPTKEKTPEKDDPGWLRRHWKHITLGAALGAAGILQHCPRNNSEKPDAPEPSPVSHVDRLSIEGLEPTPDSPSR